MTGPAHYLMLTAAGIVAGTLNAVAAGGALFSFLALGWAGVPPQIANATNLAATPASFIGTGINAWTHRKDNTQHWPLLAVAVAGTVAGVVLFRITPAASFKALVPLLLILAAVALVANPVLKRHLDRRAATTGAAPRAWPVAGIGATSVYAGYFGGAVGVWVLLVFATTTSWPWLRANEVKNLVCLGTSVIGLIAFAFTGLIDVPLAALLAVSMAVGGLLGQWVITKLQKISAIDAQDLLRGIVAVVAGVGAGAMLP